MVATHAVPGFLPSINGLSFANRFPPGPTLRLGPIDPSRVGIGNAAAGLCGGMSWYVRECYEARMPVPRDAEAPANGAPLFRALVRRQVLSLDWLRVPLRFWRMGQQRPTDAARRSIGTEWPRIRAAIDDDRLAMIGLVRHTGRNPLLLTQGHQVLAHAYELDGDAVTLHVYDPNWPARDDIRIAGSAAGWAQSTGEPLMGILALP